MMRVASRLNRFRVRCVHLVFCGIIFCAIYIVLYRDLGISLPAAELDNKPVEVPLRYVELMTKTDRAREGCLGVITETFILDVIINQSNFYNCLVLEVNSLYILLWLN